MSDESIKLVGVQETLLMPLWGRAIEYSKKKPILIDKIAYDIINSIKYDFSTIEKKVNKLSLASWIARSIYFDDQIKSFIAKCPDALILNIGCGLDTTYERIDNGKIKWVDIDFPEVIDVRRKYIKESQRRKFLAKSIFDIDWNIDIPKSDHIMIMIAGVVYYFEENEVKRLFTIIQQQLKNVEIVFDYSSIRGVKIANKKVIDDGGMDKSAHLAWGIDDIYQLETWNLGIRILENCEMFSEHRKRYSFYKRIGMAISDKLKIMSLVHMEISSK